MSNKMYDGITGRSPIATDDLGYIGTGQKASQIMSNGTTDYNDLSNKPTINNVELSSNKTSSDLGLQSALTETQTAAVNSGVTSETVSQVETNKNNILSLSPTNFTTPTIAADGIEVNLTIVYGGYFKVGKLTIFTIRFTIGDTLIKGRWLFEGMPKSAHTTSLNDGASLAPCQIVTVLNGVDTKGTICKKDSTSTGIAIPSTGNDMTAGTYLISGYYLSE